VAIEGAEKGRRIPRFTYAVSLLANVRRIVGARDEHGPLTLEERAPMQAQGHLCVAQGRQTPFTDLLLGKRRGSLRHRRRRRRCLLLGWRHASCNERTGPTNQNSNRPLEKLEKPKEVATRLVARESATAFLELH
jgi:hypothetical protein